MKQRTMVSWSSGKDSAWALHMLRQRSDIEVTGLFCTVNQAFERVAMHAVRVELLRRQAQRLGLPLEVIPIPYPCSNLAYERIMEAFVVAALLRQTACMAFGDIFLEDVRAYREKNLAASGIKPLFPLWGRRTDPLAQEMLTGGLRARVTCVDLKALPTEVVGREFDAAFLRDLPDGVDPCGENGEFHTFVYAGPMFESPLAVRPGEVVRRDGFAFADLRPGARRPDRTG